MKIVVDLNIIFAALLKDATVRNIILMNPFDFYFPKRSFEKIQKYKDYIIEKTGLDESELNTLRKSLFQNMKLLSDEEIQKQWENAKVIMAEIDPEDTAFIAAALCINNAIIWSEDKDFEKQEKVRVFKTKDIIKMLEGT